MLSAETRGMLMGTIGVAMFAMTLPMTRWAVADLDPVWLAFARAEGAAALALVALLLTRAPRPDRRHWPALVAVSLGVIVGFPLFSSIAMRSSEASHGAVITGLMPLATAFIGARLAGDRPSKGFWIAAITGSALVCGFALHAGAGRFGAGTLWMLAAVVSGAAGYAWGGRLARELGGWQTIAWSLVFSAPLLAGPTLWLSWHHELSSASTRAWIGFAWVTVFSQFIGFYFWYGGMAIGGVTRVSQVQLLQIFMTLVFASWIGGEEVDAATWAIAAAVVATVAIGRRAPVRPYHPVSSKVPEPKAHR
jgi:drug/metabolite transporter (DMT)-like permease